MARKRALTAPVNAVKGLEPRVSRALATGVIDKGERYATACD
jgi:hypothetical protein